MKTLIFDIQMGSSGDMLLGSLLDLGLDAHRLVSSLKGLGLPGWEINPSRVVKHHLQGTLAGVTARDEAHERHLGDIRAIIDKSALDPDVRADIMKVFTALARAEASVHGTGIEHVHFHEVGALDSIVDIAAFCLGVRMMGAQRILFTEFCFGSGTVVTRHGEIPEPVPAVLELSRGFRTRVTDRRGEMTTPTAAALLVTLGTQVSGMPAFTVLGAGTGFGTREHGFPSYTRAVLAESNEDTNRLFQLECTIDDMNPQLYPHVIARAFSMGARDAYVCPVIMKKGRPGILLSVLVDATLAGQVREMLFRETTTLGIRMFPVEREVLERSFDSVEVRGKSIRIKTGYYRGTLANIQPEYEDCLTCAGESGAALKEIMAEAVRKYRAARGLD
mgnify:CR=1 FL=1